MSGDLQTQAALRQELQRGQADAARLEPLWLICLRISCSNRQGRIEPVYNHLIKRFNRKECFSLDNAHMRGYHIEK